MENLLTEMESQDVYDWLIEKLNNETLAEKFRSELFNF